MPYQPNPIRFLLSSLSLLLIILPTTHFINAQSLSDLPSCAQQAGLSGITASGCAVQDIACICGKTPFIATLRQYICQSCSVADQTASLQFAQRLCATVGITIPADMNSCGQGSATGGSAGGSGSGSGSGSSAAALAPAPAASNAGTSAAAAPGPSTTTAPSSAPAGSGITTAPSISPSGSGSGSGAFTNTCSTCGTCGACSGGSNMTVGTAGAPPAQFTGAAPARDVPVGGGHWGAAAAVVAGAMIFAA